MATDKHKQLALTAIWWLHKNGCSVFANEVPTRNGIADALGIVTRAGSERVYYIEAKASRSDLICAKQKAVYARSVTASKEYCSIHSLLVRNKKYRATYGEDRIEKEIAECSGCQSIMPYDMHIDYYYVIVADGVTVEPELYPEWGVLNESGIVVRRAKKMPKTSKFDHRHYLEAIAHVLVYKLYGKLYIK